MLSYCLKYKKNTESIIPKVQKQSMVKQLLKSKKQKDY